MDPDFDHLETIACGEMGLSIDEFYSITPRQFDNMLTGYRRKEEHAERLKWEINRTLMMSIISPHIDKKDRHKTVFDFYPLPWDQEQKPKVQAPKGKKRSGKERDALFNKMDALNKNNDGGKSSN